VNLPTVHPPTRRDVPAHGSHRARRRGGVWAAARFGAARGGLSHDPGRHLLPGRKPRRDGSAVTAPLERQFGQVPGLNQMTSTSSDGSSVIHPAVLAEPRHRRRRAGSPSGDQCRADVPAIDLPAPPVYSNPIRRMLHPDLALTSKTVPLSKVQDLADTRWPRRSRSCPGSVSSASAAARSPPSGSRRTPPRCRRMA